MSRSLKLVHSMLAPHAKPPKPKPIPAATHQRLVDEAILEELVKKW